MKLLWTLRVSLPLALDALSHAIAFVALSWPHVDAHRKKVTAVIIVVVAMSFATMDQLTPDLESRVTLVLFMLLWLSHMTNVLLVKRPQTATKSTKERYYLAYRLLYNGRWVGKEFESQRSKPTTGTDGVAKLNGARVPPAKQVERVRSDEPSRVVFALKKAELAVLAFYAMKYYTLYSPAPKLYLRHYNAGRVPGLDVRLWTVVHHLMGTYLFMNFFHAASAAVFVGLLRLDSPEDWPPYFGSWSEAYTIQRFWSKFWHSIVYETYSSFANVAISSVRTVKTTEMNGGATKTSRQRDINDLLMRNFLIFFYSGLLHGLARLFVGQGSLAWMETFWFVLNFVATCAERVFKERFAIKGSRSWLLRAFQRLVGYCWVLGFFCWTVPWRYWPRWELTQQLVA